MKHKLAGLILMTILLVGATATFISIMVLNYKHWSSKENNVTCLVSPKDLPVRRSTEVIDGKLWFCGDADRVFCVPAEEMPMSWCVQAAAEEKKRDADNDRYSQEAFRKLDDEKENRQRRRDDLESALLERLSALCR